MNTELERDESGEISFTSGNNSLFQSVYTNSAQARPVKRVFPDCLLALDNQLAPQGN